MSPLRAATRADPGRQRREPATGVVHGELPVEHRADQDARHQRTGHPTRRSQTGWAGGGCAAPGFSAAPNHGRANANLLDPVYFRSSCKRKVEVAMNTPPIVSAQAWAAAREQLLVKEKGGMGAHEPLGAGGRGARGLE